MYSICHVNMYIYIHICTIYYRANPVKPCIFLGTEVAVVSVMGAFRTGKHGKPRKVRPEKKGPFNGCLGVYPP